MKLDSRGVGKGCNELYPYILALVETFDRGNGRIPEILGVR